MTKNELKLVMYPSFAGGVSGEEKQQLIELLRGEEDFDTAQLVELLLEPLSDHEMAVAAAEIKDEELKKEIYYLAKSMVAVDGIDEREQQALDLLHQALRIDDAELFALEVKSLPSKADSFEEISRRYAMVAGAIGFIPIPLSDFSLLAPLQVYMVREISEHYKYPVDAKELLKMIIGTVGLGYTFAVAARSLMAFVPVVGWFVAGGVAFAGTYAIAIVTKRYIEHKGELSPQTIQTIYRDSFADGKKVFMELKDEIGDRKDELLAELKKRMK